MIKQPKTQLKVITDIIDERLNQDEKWGDLEEQAKVHDITSWMVVLGEEFGESCQDALKYRFDKDFTKTSLHLYNLRAELVQTAAVAVAIIESIDKGLFE